MQSVGVQHIFQSIEPLFHWGTYCVFNLVQQLILQFIDEWA